MAEQYLIYDDSLSSIGDAIRAKYGDTTKYYPREMPEAIRGIPDAGGDEWWKLVDRTMQVFGDYEGLIYNIHTRAFHGCTQLESVYLLNNTIISFSTWAPYAGYAFSHTPIFSSSYIGHYGSIFVPSNLVTSYRRTSGWSSFSSRITSYATLAGERGSESNQYLIYDETLTNIGGAIRERLAEADEYYPRDMPAAIMRIGGSVDECGPLMASIVNGTIVNLDDTSGKATFAGAYAFADITTLKTIRFPACTSMDMYVFSGCTALESASFNVLKSIPEGEFAGCSALHTVSFPVCETIGSDAFLFEGSFDTDTKFPACTSLGMSVFGTGWGTPQQNVYCEAIHFPVLPIYPGYVAGSFVSVDCPVCTKIEEYAFLGMDTLESVSFPVCETIENYAFQSCTALTSVSFPKCTDLSRYAFAGCSSTLESVYFDVLPEISSSTFYGFSALHTVSFPSCETIGSNAFLFEGSFDIDTEFSACKSIGRSAFGNGRTGNFLSNVYCEAIHFSVLEYYPPSVYGSFVSVDCPECTEIGSSAFRYMDTLESVSFPLCETIGTEAFWRCSSLQEADFPECTSIGDGAFDYAEALTLASFPVCETVDFDAFSSCSALETAYFPSCISIDTRAFAGCNVLSSIDFTSCESIGDYGFQSCSAIQSMSFDYLSYIGGSAFSDCTSLSALYLMSTSVVSTGGSSIRYMFSHTPIDSGSGYIYVPANLYSTYCSASKWSNYSAHLSSI